MKNEGKINLLSLIMIPVLIGIGILIGYIAFSNKCAIEDILPNDNSKISEVEEDEISNLENQNIEGIFIEDIVEANDSPIYVFYSDGKVVEEGNAIRKGTYKIENNNIKIKYNIFIAPEEAEEEDIDEESVLKLIDENTIEGYKKYDVKNDLIGKWSVKSANDSDFQKTDLLDIIGSLENRFGDIVFKEDNTYTNNIEPISSESDEEKEGTYSISGDQVILNSKSGKTKTISFSFSKTLYYSYDKYTLWLQKNDDTSNVNDTQNSKSNDNYKQFIEGYEVKGTIEIPKTNVNEPILDSVTKRSLEKGFAIAYGPGLNEVGNTVIYVNGTKLYKDNKEIVSGDIINITDQSGTKVIYEVYDVHEIDNNDASYMLRETNGNIEISIQTGSQNPEKRTVIFARKVR